MQRSSSARLLSPESQHEDTRPSESHLTHTTPQGPRDSPEPPAERG